MGLYADVLLGKRVRRVSTKTIKPVWFAFLSLVAAGLALGFVLVGLAVPAGARTTTRCASVFPEAVWVAGDSSVVDVGFSSVAPGLADRFTSEIEATATPVTSEIGGLDSVAVCVAGRDPAIDVAMYLEPTKRFHAILDHDQDVLVLSAESPGNIRKAAAFGIPQLALWNASGRTGWPEPIASAIGQWYRARVLDRMTQYRVLSTGADFSVDRLTGESNFGLDFDTDARIEWVAGTQPAQRTWDPSRNDTPIGYFIEYTVANEGIEVLFDPDAGAWERREEAWRSSLVTDLTGRDDPTTGWVTGVSIAVLMLIASAALATGSFLTKRRKQQRRTTSV